MRKGDSEKPQKMVMWWQDYQWLIYLWLYIIADLHQRIEVLNVLVPISQGKEAISWLQYLVEYSLQFLIPFLF